MAQKRSLDSIVDKTARVLALASSIAVLAITVAIVIDVVGRSIWSKPLDGASEFAVTALIAVVFLGLARAQRTGGNFRVDLVIRLLPESLRWVLETVWRVLAAVLVGLLAWLSVAEAITSTAMGESTFGTITFPVWPARLILAFGLCVLFLQIVVEIIRLCMGLPPIDEFKPPVSAE